MTPWHTDNKRLCQVAWLFIDVNTVKAIHLYTASNGNWLTHLPLMLFDSLDILSLDNNPLDSRTQAYIDFLLKLGGWHRKIETKWWLKIYQENHADNFAVFLDKRRQGKNNHAA